MWWIPHTESTHKWCRRVFVDDLSAEVDHADPAEVVRLLSGFLVIVCHRLVADGLESSPAKSVVTATTRKVGEAIADKLSGFKVRDLTWFGVAEAGADMDADSMLWQRGRLGSAGAVAITDAAGALQGLAFEDDMWAVPADERPWVLLTQMMVPFDRTARVGPDDDLASVLPKINQARPIVTVWQDGRLVGLVPPRRLREQLTAAGL